MTKDQEMSSSPKQQFAFSSPRQTTWGIILFIKGDKAAVAYLKINTGALDF